MDLRPTPAAPWFRAAFLRAAGITFWMQAALPAAVHGADPHAAFFEEKVRPVLVNRCLSCHSDTKQKAGLRLDSLVGMLRGGESGAAIVPGEPDESNLVMAIRHDGWEMPPDGKLPDAEIEAITEWVRQGAPWPGTKPAADLLAEGLPEEDTEPAPLFGPPQRKQKSVITDADRSYWAYQPVRRPDVPPRPAGEGIRDGLVRAEIHSPIDAFILAKLAAQGIEPVAEADRETLARRLFFDLLGVPPAPADVASFVADPSPDAYDRLVDRLLADPRYGERQARHWLDLARYAESDGFRQDAFRPTAWRYRDWCIAAFNADMPFDRFVKAQLAADEFFPADPAMAAATGFLRQTPYEYNQVDVETQRREILNEVTDVTADVFLAMGMGCARCHDHKYDPILQRDYFALQAFFTPLVWKDDQTVAAPPTDPPAPADRPAELRQELAAIRAACRDPEAWGGFKRFPPSVQELIFKPRADRTPHEEQIVKLASRQLVFDPKKLPEAERARYEAVEAELAVLKAAGSLPPPAPTALSVADVGPTPPPTTIPGKPALGEIEPRVPTVLGGQDLKPDPLRDDGGAPLSTGRRAALASWLASPDNPLTARVFVNRLWQWHFGKGLVGTASDFGVLGEQATHSELLDWLAAEFVENGWSVKHLHRLVVTSAAYRRSSRAADAGESAGPAIDPQNKLLWRQNPRRLDAEQVRDAALAIAGDLDPRPAGPSTPPSKPRRAIYTTVIRNTRDDLCDVFDGADAYASCARRNATTTALQALYLVNGEWMLARARSLALAIEQGIEGRTDGPSGGQAADEAAAAEVIRRVTGREPGPERLAAAVAFLAEQRKRIDAAASTQSIAVVQRMPQRAGLAAVIDPADPAAVLRAAGTDWPAGDFTIEAHVILQSLFADATVRTIASQWTGRLSDPGWSLGVTSEKSKYKPRNLIVQLAGDTSRQGSPYLVIPSDIHLQLQRPYYVAASVKTSGGEQERSVTFFVKDLSDNDAPLAVKTVPHAFAGSHTSPRAFAIGGRDSAAATGAAAHVWDGLIDDVRLSNRPLVQSELLWEDGDPGDAVIGHWMFEETPGFAADSSGRGHALVRGVPQPHVKDLRRYEALVDLCHVLFNTSEFLYVE
jgi:hypothetical protein